MPIRYYIFRAIILHYNKLINDQKVVYLMPVWKIKGAGLAAILTDSIYVKSHSKPPGKEVTLALLFVAECTQKYPNNIVLLGHCHLYISNPSTVTYSLEYNRKAPVT